MVEIKKNKKDQKAKKEKDAPVVKTKGIDNIMSLVRKKFGDEVVYKVGSITRKNIEVIPTGSFQLDKALGIGGLPRGRVVEIIGKEGGGKTTLALSVMALAQKLYPDEEVGFIDAEHALSISMAETIGVNTKDLLISQPDYGEQALEVLETLISTCAFSVLVVDSVASLVPKAELDGDMTDAVMGGQARMMGKALRKITGIVSKSNTMVIFINQIRHKIGVMFGSSETTSGGNALRFYSSVRIDIRATGKLKDGEAIYGNKVKVKVIKNKLASPFKEIVTELIFGKGFNTEGEIIDLAVEEGILEKNGSHYSYGEDRLVQGKSSLEKFFRDKDNEKLFNEIKEKLTESLNAAEVY